MSLKSIWPNVAFKTISFLLIFCLNYVSIVVSRVLKSSTTTVLLFYFLSFCLLILALYTWVFLCWVHRYLQLLYPLLELTPLSVWKVILCLFLYYLFKEYFIWYEYCSPSFLFLSICMEYLFPSLHFQFVCVF